MLSVAGQLQSRCPCQTVAGTHDEPINLMESHGGSAFGCAAWDTCAIWCIQLSGGRILHGGPRSRAGFLRVDVDVNVSICIDDVDGKPLEFFAESPANPVGGEPSPGTHLQAIVLDRQLRVLEPHCDGAFTQAIDELFRQLGRDVVAVGGHVIKLLLVVVDFVAHILPNESDVSSFGTFFLMRNVVVGSALRAFTLGCTPVFAGSQSS